MKALFLALVFCLCAFSEDSEFEIDRTLLENLYRSSIEEVKVETRQTAGGSFEVGFQVAALSPSQLLLSNHYFEVPYHEVSPQFPMVALTFTAPLFAFSSFEGYGSFKAGYAYREATYRVISQSGSQGLRDIIKLQWIPLLLSTKLAYRLPFAPMIVPAVSAGAGAQWFSQEGRLDGITQGFWVPYYQWGGSLALFDYRYQGHWFGGVNIGGSVQNSFGSSQSVQAVAWELGTTFIF